MKFYKGNYSILKDFMTVYCQVMGLKREFERDYIEDGFEPEDYECVWESMVEDYNYCNDDSWYFEQDEWNYYLKDITNAKTYKHFLIVYYGANWRNQVGYKFVDDYSKVLDFDYDVSIYHLAKDENKAFGGKYDNKFNVFNVSSHDIPMGNDYIIIGLTDKQYEDIVDKDFNSIIEYANKYYEKYKKESKKNEII